MPNRIIKESIRTSRSVNEMTDFQFRLWIYLITYVDDYGRGSADPELLKGFVFPRRKRVTESDIAKTLAELAGMSCINLYDVDGESYFYFPNWGEHQRIQTKRSKFPEPPQNGSQQESTVNHGESPPESESESEYNISLDGASAAEENLFEKTINADEVFEKTYSFYPRKDGKGKADGKSTYLTYLTSGKTKKGQGVLKYNHYQIAIAIKAFADDMNTENRDEKMVDYFSTFMNSDVIDYIERTEEEYRELMIERFGDEWGKIKFVYTYKNQKKPPKKGGEAV